MIAADSLIGLFGCGGAARELMPVLRAQGARDGISADHIVFVDRDGRPDALNGHQVLSEDDFFAAPGTKLVHIGVGDGHLRHKLMERAISRGAKPLSIISEQAHFLDADQIGEGAAFCAFSLVMPNVRIGVGFQCNTYASVAHDCVIGDYVTFGPGARCNGTVEIGDYAYIGSGAVIRQGQEGRPLRIGKGAVVGMGAVVIRDVPDGVTVVGNPARPIVKGQGA